ncbi:hypothetical protein BDF21DRAFT_333242 [Thamnidium elegans]|nr:hypothetical protein BDF21DRAFT_333242 [Thamnidium elegans]
METKKAKPPLAIKHEEEENTFDHTTLIPPHEETKEVDAAILLPVDLSAIPLPEEDPQRYLSIQSHDIIIPSYAAWFDITTIHSIESKALPEFFNDRNKSKTPTVYMEYRDFMINTYRMNPIEYLTITACRRNLTGDVCAILRVHAFLEQWGLINYQVDPDAKLSSLSPPFDSQFKVVIDKPLEPKEQDNREESQDEEKQAKEEKTEVKHYYDAHKEKKPQVCASCQQACQDEQYCSTTQPDFYICKQCFIEGKYPVNQMSGHFVLERFEKEQNKWDKEEEDLLKEGLGMFGDNWEKISNHVGTRTHDECVLHYLQLPLNDPFQDVEIEKLGLLQYDSIQHKENPIMTAVAFLASAVEPKVAAAAGDIDVFEIIPVKIDNDKVKLEQEQEKDEGQDEEEEEEKKPERNEIEESKLIELTNTLFKCKLIQYQQQFEDYQSLENRVEEQKRQLEKERRQLEQDQSVFKRKVLSIRQEIAKSISKANALASIITPAQLQQQLAGASPSMFLNGNQHHPSPQALQQLQLQQQQYQLQMQMQMQQHDQPRSNLPPGFNNIMTL